MIIQKHWRLSVECLWVQVSVTKPFCWEELLARMQCHLDLQKARLTLQKNLRLAMELEKQKQENAQARRAAMESKREKLRYQINPHFLFNALASIRGAVFTHQDAAYDMITHHSHSLPDSPHSPSSSGYFFYPQ